MKAVWKAARALPLLLLAVDAANPIVPGVGMADPHMHVWPAQPDKVYVYATHDCNRAGDASQPCAAAAGELGFLMEDWWVWSSTDLVAWTQEARVYPTALAYENANTTDECWARSGEGPREHATLPQPHSDHRRQCAVVDLVVVESRADRPARVF